MGNDDNESIEETEANSMGSEREINSGIMRNETMSNKKDNDEDKRTKLSKKHGLGTNDEMTYQATPGRKADVDSRREDNNEMKRRRVTSEEIDERRGENDEMERRTITSKVIDEREKTRREEQARRRGSVVRVST